MPKQNPRPRRQIHCLDRPGQIPRPPSQSLRAEASHWGREKRQLHRIPPRPPTPPPTNPRTTPHTAALDALAPAAALSPARDTHLATSHTWPDPAEPPPRPATRTRRCLSLQPPPPTGAHNARGRCRQDSRGRCPGLRLPRRPRTPPPQQTRTNPLWCGACRHHGRGGRRQRRRWRGACRRS